MNDRDYSARDVAEEEGQPNPAAERIDQELRASLVEQFGRPFYGSPPKEGTFKINRLNARFFAGLFQSKYDVLFEGEENRLYLYVKDTGLWVRQRDTTLREKIAAFLLSESRRPGCEEMEQKLNVRFYNEVIDLLRGIVEKTGVFARNLDYENHNLHLRNGIYRFQDGKAPTFTTTFSKEIFSRNRCPIVYDAGAECPKFIDKCLRPHLDPEAAEEDTEMLFRFIGLFLLGVNLPQRILILLGEGDTGKSTIANLCTTLVGEENFASLRTEQLEQRFEWSAFIGRTLLVGADVKSNFLSQRGASDLKKLTGGDPLRAESKLGNDRVFMRGDFNMLISANGSQLDVRLDSDAEAWARRLVMIPFFEAKAPRKPIPHFESIILKEEGPGIINRAIAALERYLDEGEFVLSPVQRFRVEQVVQSSDQLREFLAERIQVLEGSSLAKVEIREAYSKHCRNHRWGVPKDRDMGRRLPELMKGLFDVSQSNSVNGPAGTQVTGYRGVHWKPDYRH